MDDIFPVFEVSIAAVTFILGFAAARYHGHVSAARDLISQLSGEFAQAATTTGMSARDRLNNLERLASSSLAPDKVAEGVVYGAWVWLAATTVLLAMSLDRGLLGASSEVSLSKAGVAFLLTALVTIAGHVDAVWLRQELGRLRLQTTVGLLATAADKLEARDDGGRVPRDSARAALTHMQNAVTRSPSLSWVYAVRAQAHQALGNEAAATADYGRAFALDPQLAAGLFDQVAQLSKLDLSREAADWFARGHQAAPAEAERRLRSMINGHIRWLLLGSGRQSARVENARRRELSEGVIDPGTSKNHLELAVRLWRAGQPLEGLETLGKLDATMGIDADDSLPVIVVAAAMRHQLGLEAIVSASDLQRLSKADERPWLAAGYAHQLLVLADSGRAADHAELRDQAQEYLDPEFLHALDVAAAGLLTSRRWAGVG